MMLREAKSFTYSWYHNYNSKHKTLIPPQTTTYVILCFSVIAPRGRPIRSNNKPKMPLAYSNTRLTQYTQFSCVVDCCWSRRVKESLSLRTSSREGNMHPQWRDMWLQYRCSIITYNKYYFREVLFHFKPFLSI